MSGLTPQERREQFVALAKGDQGERGAQGNQGNRGERGEPLSPAVRRTLIYLFTLMVLLAVANLYWTSHVVRENNQQRCASLEQLAHIPIPRPVAGNPSRKFASDLEMSYRERARQIGCG